MTEKVYLRKCEFYSVKRASNPIEIDVDKLRQCNPKYTGTTHDDLIEYLTENVFDNPDWLEQNKEIYKDPEITGEELYIENEYFDSREKGADEWMEIGIPTIDAQKMDFLKHL